MFRKRTKQLDSMGMQIFHKSHFRLWYVWVVIFVRFLTGVYILINPLAGLVSMFIADYFDAYFLKHLAKMSWVEYHRLDKYLDWTNYIFMIIVAFQYGYGSTLIGWLLFRLIGQLIFLKTRKAYIFLVFPNFFEFAFLWYVVVVGILKFDGAGIPTWIWLTSLFILKELQEIWLHFIWPRYLKKNGYPHFLNKLGYEKVIIWE